MFQAVLTEIECYADTIASLATQSEELKSLPTTTAHLSQQIDSQLINLDESYSSLMTSAAQIKVRLGTHAPDSNIL